MSGFVIQQATIEEMSFFIDAARREGWNPGMDDATPFYKTDPTGFFIGKLNHDPIGCISTVAYNHSYGFLGFYIVLPPFRSQGYGLKLWNHGISYLGERSMGLDGVVDQQDNYRKSGFQFYYNNIRYKGQIKGQANSSLKKIKDVSFEELNQYDSKVCGFDRTSFLKNWIWMPNSYGLVKVDEKMRGYGVIRKCATGYKIGPLFADNIDTAKEILLGLAAPFKKEDIFLDLVQIHKDSFKLVEAFNLEKVFETARMYKGTPPAQKMDHIYGVTTFELG